VVGVVDRTDRSFSFNVEKVVIHRSADIAIIKTNKYIEFIENNNWFQINSICLPKGDPISLKTFFSGWGKYSEDNEETGSEPIILKKTIMSLSPSIFCQTILLVKTVGLVQTSNNILCVVNSNSTACEV
jgi:hypothetical protein